MKKLILVLLGLCAYAVSFSANAWIVSYNVKIVQVIEWQDNRDIYIKLSNQQICYFPADEKNMYGLVLTLYATGKKANIHCHDNASPPVGGLTGHRLHRILSLAN